MNNYFKNTLEKEDGEKFTVTYFLTESSGEDTGTEYGMGIRIEDTGEERCIDAISPDRSRVETLLELCFKNSVTPTTLFDVVYDFICA